MAKKPHILIPANVIDYIGSPGHIVRETYLRALMDVADCIPLILPAIGDFEEIENTLSLVDGIVLTGSPSHVAPACYGAEQTFGNDKLDKARDSTTLPLIRRVLDKDIPLLAVCRGFQEMNVVCGGTLHQCVQELPGKMDHRAPAGIGITEAYERRAHPVIRKSGGLLEKMGAPEEFMVNTVHENGVDKLGSGLFIEAEAPDGMIEAFSFPGKRFALGTQWHPEGDFRVSEVSVMIFKAFGQAVRG